MGSPAEVTQDTDQEELRQWCQSKRVSFTDPLKHARPSGYSTHMLSSSPQQPSRTPDLKSMRSDYEANALSPLPTSLTQIAGGRVVI